MSGKNIFWLITQNNLTLKYLIIYFPIALLASQYVWFKFFKKQIPFLTNSISLNVNCRETMLFSFFQLFIWLKKVHSQFMHSFCAVGFSAVALYFFCLSILKIWFITEEGYFANLRFLVSDHYHFSKFSLSLMLYTLVTLNFYIVVIFIINGWII